MCLRHGKFSWAFLVLSDGISRFQLCVLKELLGLFEQRLLGTAQFSCSMIPVWQKGFLFSKHLKKKAAFFPSGKIYRWLCPSTDPHPSSRPGCPDAGGAAPPVGITSCVPGLFWGWLCPSWPGRLTSLQRLPPPCLTASCVLRVRTTGPFNLWSMHTFSFFRRPTPPQLHVSLSALQFLEIQHTKYNQTQSRMAKRVFKLLKYFLIYYF